MKNIFKHFLLFSAFVGIQFTQFGPVKAIDAFDAVCSQSVPAGVDKPTVCKDKIDPANNPISGNDGVILRVLGLMRIIAGALAVIYIIVSALSLISSSGDSSKLKETRDTIVYASAGLLVILIAPEIVKYFLNWVNP
jgi:Type IV secretion system pilin